VALEMPGATLTLAQKQKLLSIVTTDVVIDAKRSPLLVAMNRTTHSLHACFEGTTRKICYPVYDL